MAAPLWGAANAGVVPRHAHPRGGPVALGWLLPRGAAVLDVADPAQRPCHAARRGGSLRGRPLRLVCKVHRTSALGTGLGLSRRHSRRPVCRVRSHSRRGRPSRPAARGGRPCPARHSLLHDSRAHRPLAAVLVAAAPGHPSPDRQQRIARYLAAPGGRHGDVRSAGDNAGHWSAGRQAGGRRRRAFHAGAVADRLGGHHPVRHLVFEFWCSSPRSTPTPC